MKRAAIIQARMSSTRLPGKVLIPVAGKAILGHVLDRVTACRSIDVIVVATTTNACDEEIASYVASYGNGIQLFRGSEDDVLDRYYQAAVQFQADWVIRVTSDSPLLDPDVIDFVVGSTIGGEYDYGSNSLVPSMPDGLDAECMAMKALARAWREAALPAEREHVTPYLRVNHSLFRLLNVAYPLDCSALCWAVDSPDDLRFISELARRINLFDRAHYPFEKILQVLRAFPQLKTTNQGSIRDVKLLDQIPNIFFRHEGKFDVRTYPVKDGSYELSIL